MDTSSFIGLLYNAILLIALGVIYDALNIESIENKMGRELVSGLFVGLLGIAVMNTSWEMAPGVLFDTRWVLISLCGLFFGLVPTLIAGVMMVSLRLNIGGAGASSTNPNKITTILVLYVVCPVCLKKSNLSMANHATIYSRKSHD